MVFWLHPVYLSEFWSPLLIILFTLCNLFLFNIIVICLFLTCPNGSEYPERADPEMLNLN